MRLFQRRPPAASSPTAVLRPSLEDCERLVIPLNEGERRVAEALATLDDGWTIYVQPRLANDIPDFVAVHGVHGVCAIEVKDWSRGKYRMTDAGRIQYVTGDGTWHDSDQRPRYQAHRYRSTIFDRYFALPDDAASPTDQIRAAVIMPDYTTADADRLFHRVQATRGEEKIKLWGGDQLEASIGRIVGTCKKPPRPESIERLHRQLRDSVATTELRAPIALSADARNVATNPSNARRRRVRGPAGCGKSFGLAARAARLAQQGQTVLVVTYNSTLSNYLRSLVSARCHELGVNPSRVNCVHIHAFCHRLVDEARHVGFEVGDYPKLRFDEVVQQAADVLAAGFACSYDAVLIDEGQDFSLDWWNMFRHHVVVDDGEMLLVADPTQDVYNKQAWTDEERMLGAGFSGPWTELKGSYRLPTDMVDIANQFAVRYLDGDKIEGDVPSDHTDLFGSAAMTVRNWTNIASRADLGTNVGHEVVRLLTAYPDLSPNDMAFLCETHEDGIQAVEVIEAAGFPVHHIFASQRNVQRRRKQRFWPDAPGVKGCTVHSFKGWEAIGLVMGIGISPKSSRLAYVAMTRLRNGGEGRPAYISVVNADLQMAGFDSTFRQWKPIDAQLWTSPNPATRVG